jgi:hypothetical protein
MSTNTKDVNVLTYARDYNRASLLQRLEVAQLLQVTRVYNTAIRHQNVHNLLLFRYKVISKKTTHLLKR